MPREIAQWVPLEAGDIGSIEAYAGAYEWEPGDPGNDQDNERLDDIVIYPFNQILPELNGGSSTISLTRGGAYVHIPVSLTDIDGQNAANVENQLISIIAGSRLSVRYESRSVDGAYIELSGEVGTLGFLDAETYYRFQCTDWTIDGHEMYVPSFFVARFISYKVNSFPFPALNNADQSPVDLWVDIATQFQGEGIVIGTDAVQPTESVELVTRYNPAIDTSGNMVFDGRTWDVVGINRLNRNDMSISCQRALT